MVWLKKGGLFNHQKGYTLFFTHRGGFNPFGTLKVTIFSSFWGRGPPNLRCSLSLKGRDIFVLPNPGSFRGGGHPLKAKLFFGHLGKSPFYGGFFFQSPRGITHVCAPFFAHTFCAPHGGEREKIFRAQKKGVFWNPHGGEEPL